MADHITPLASLSLTHVYYVSHLYLSGSFFPYSNSH